MNVRHSRPAFKETTYPSAWIKEYSESCYIIGDPSIVWGIGNSGFIRWSDLGLVIGDPLSILTQAARYGLSFGAAVAHHDGDSFSLGSFARKDREFSDAELQSLHNNLIEGHRVVREKLPLNSGQLKALEAISHGLTYEQSCEQLGISRTALRARLAAARKRLNVDNNMMAVYQAIELGLIPYYSRHGFVIGDRRQ